MNFLADEGFPRLWTDKLRLLSFDIKECTTIPELRGQHDVQYLIPWANVRHRVLLTCDGMKDRSTRMQLLERLHRTKAGKVIHISGGPAISWQRAVGKVLLYQDRWEPFLQSGHGLVTLSDEKHAEFKRIDDLSHVVRVKSDQGWDYMYRHRHPQTVAQAAGAGPRRRLRPAPAGGMLPTAPNVEG